jgi:DNA-binding transcriptional LysR family regulator
MFLDLVKLRSLVELRDRGSMTAAATALGYTTGAVSQQIAALESTVGQPLIVHSGRRVELTDAGAVLADQAIAVLEAEGAARRAVAALAQRTGGQVRVGVFGTAAAALLPPALAQLQSCHTGVSVRSVEVDVDAAIAAVAGRSVDLAFGVDYPDAPIPRDPSVALLTLRRETFAVAAAAGTPMPGGPVPLEDLAPYSWLLPPRQSHYGLAVRMVCRRAGFEPRVDHEVTDTATTLAMVSAGLGVAPVTDLMLQLRPGGVQTFALAEPFQRVIVLAHRRRPEPQPAMLAVIEAVKQIVALG